jgi:uncharacterized protein (DUF1697 family)
MLSIIALLRAVNVGGTGKLAMAELKAICESAGFEAVRTYIASGNVVFLSDRDIPEVRAALEARLRSFAGKPVCVILRTAAEMAEVLARNPFPETPGNRVTATFLDDLTSPTILDGVTGQAVHEATHIGHREIYIRYGVDMANSKLRIPAAKAGTARNMNTVAKLAAMAAQLMLSPRRP